jgi:hypothetical protein
MATPGTIGILNVCLIAWIVEVICMVSSRSQKKIQITIPAIKKITWLYYP